MKILSIDFDYFQDITKEQLSLYPDGVDNPTYLSEIVWGNHYASDGDELRKIGLLSNEYKSLINLLEEQNPDVPVLITNSHVSIYDFINEHLSADEDLDIHNIDFHHDMINSNDCLDCGNWIGYIMKERNELGLRTLFSWIHNPISLQVYGMEGYFERLFKSRKLKNRVFSSINNITERKFDAIFLCRSDTWTAPHLDEYFSNLCNLMKDHFGAVDIEKGIDEPRSAYKEIAKEIARLMPA